MIIVLWSLKAPGRGILAAVLGAAGNSIQVVGNPFPSESILLSSLHYQWFPQCLYFHEKKNKGKATTFTGQTLMR